MLQNRRIVWPAYLVAFTLAVIPPVDALMQTMPVRLSETRWRWGAFGLLSNAMMIPMIGLLIAFVVAIAFEHRVIQRVLGVIAAVIGACTLIWLCMFALDTVQLHRDVKPAMALAFNVACTTGALKALIGIVTLAGFTWAGFSGPKRKAQPATNSMMLGGSKKSTPAMPSASIAPRASVEAK